MIAAIHQPNFLPWLGFFNKLFLSDVFILFDDVQIPNSTSYANRTNIKTSDGETFITIPIFSKVNQLYRDVKIVPGKWRKKTIKTIQFAYQKSIFFNKYFAEISSIIEDENIKYLFDLNLKFIFFIMGIFNKNSKIYFSSDIHCRNKEDTTAHIFSILKELKATTYLSGRGEGSKKYIRENDFRGKNIELIWQDFIHPVYPQLYGDFLYNLSIIDFIFNCGGAINLITEGDMK